MKVSDKYTTQDLKSKVSLEQKAAEDKKAVVSNDAFLNAEILEDLIKELKALRLNNG